MRRENFQVHGGTRFGGNVDLDEVWKLGFDHVAIATGAGKPTIVEMKNNLSRGIRKASDFLMALQLTGAFKRESLANLQIRLPVVVIGGGLTGVDTATEALAYYPLQVEKMAERYEALCRQFGATSIRRFFNDEELETLDEFITHGRAVQAERARAALEGREAEPDWAWCAPGAACAWSTASRSPTCRPTAPTTKRSSRRSRKASRSSRTWRRSRPSSTSTAPCARVVFERQRRDLAGKWFGTEELVEMPARSVLVAAGTQPNTIYEREQPGTFQLDEKRSFFQVFRRENGTALALKRGKDEHGPGFLTSYDDGAHAITVYGDNHAGLRRQRGQGHGLGARRFPQGARAVPGAHRAHARRRRRDRHAPRGLEEARAPARLRVPGRRARGPAPDADDHRGRRARAGRGAALQAGPVLPPAELRDQRAAWRARRAWRWRASR